MALPKTKADAETFFYDQYSARPRRYRPGKCAFEVNNQRGPNTHQCKKKPGHGPDGLYCWQHAQMIED